MHTENFARLCRQTRDELLAVYFDGNTTEVSRVLQSAALDPQQTNLVRRAVESALTDTFYTVLLALDGAASLGGIQQTYTLKDEHGNLICAGDGSLEAAAWEVFHSEQ